VPGKSAEMEMRGLVRLRVCGQYLSDHWGGDNHGEGGVSDCKAAESGFCARSTFGLMGIPLRPPLNQSESLNGGPLLGNRATYD
jgi:hypothetical protein